VTLVWYRDAQVQSQALPPSVTAPVGVTFFPSDAIDLDLDLARACFAAMHAQLPMVPQTGHDKRLVLLPANADLEAAVKLDSKKLLAANEPWLLQTELYADVKLQALNPGVAFGTLRVVAADDLVKGKVSFQDVVVLDRLPLELPLVAGTITEEFQTPLAHVNVLAKARKTPNLALKQARQDPQVAPLLGKLVRFEVTQGGFSLRAATQAEFATFWQKALSKPVQHPAADLSVKAVTPLDQLGFHDAKAFGGKAANYAELHNLWAQRKELVKALSFGWQDTFTPGGCAVPFSAYEDHVTTTPMAVADCDAAAAECQKSTDVDLVGCQGAHKLCLALVADAKPAHVKAYVAALLQRPEFTANSVVRAAVLHGLRHRIASAPIAAAFAQALDAMVQSKFPSGQPIRLRSSSNGEDLAGFTGAGLYESYGAFPTGEKKASARIGKTWASAWTLPAFEERTFWRIDHLDVRMGVLIHQAWPDEIANGVLITANLVDPASWGYYINAQKGEESVTNPLGGITPEVLVAFWDIVQGQFVPRIRRLQWSSLSPSVALADDNEYGHLTRAVWEAEQHFAKLYGKKTDEIAFELDWKLHDPQRNLYIKQIRPF
jgi:hypothetical protein